MKIGEINTKLSLIKKEASKKSKEIELLVSKVEKEQSDMSQITEYMWSELNSMLTWIGSWLNSEYVFSAINKEPKDKFEYKLPKWIDFPKVIEIKSDVFESFPKSSKIAGIPKQIESIKKLLRKSQVELIEESQKMNERQITLQEDINQTNQFKIEISEDFNRLKNSLIATESSITIMTSEKEELEESIKNLKEKYSIKDKEFLDIREEYDRFLWDILFSLETALCKYENHESINKTFVSMESGLLQKIKSELENPNKEKTLDKSEKKTG